jgi:hypothetical protein
MNRQSDDRFPNQEASLSGTAKGPFGADWEERAGFARLRTDPVLSLVDHEERLLG